MLSLRWPQYSAIAGFSTVGLIYLASLGVKAPVAVHSPPVAVAVEAAAQPQVVVQVPAVEITAASEATPEAGHFDRLRARLRWVQTRVGKENLRSPDLQSRMLLAKSAAKRAGLSEVGLTFADVYGLINAETNWVPRDGASKDGTPNLGLAQFEPATARALGVRDPHDPVEAVHAAALHMKHAAQWSSERLQGMKLDAGERAEKLREGVSVYYNLSTRGRNAWNGRNTDSLPVETQRHIQNTRLGAQEALFADAQLRAMGNRSAARATMTASN